MQNIKRIVASFAVLTLFAVCEQNSDQTEAAPATGAGQVGTVRGLESGDIACYVQMQLQNGQQTTMLADFELCDPAWIGKRVRFTTTESSVQSPECQGDPECTLSVTETLITSFTEI
ncbi:MAG: hypothetical protein H7A21_14670 [Spirochaetales bacterium]|nr:hypothetical protein [Leptospiraceae bacterium]MCP5482676.1 hypothetical protein [Spirochaetales bacterium]MCP5485058.1 hypothetical protein [Spirochaetales bacterium]